MTRELVPVNPQDGSDEEYERLARLLSGEAGAEERAESERWLAADPARLVLRDQLLDDWRVAGAQMWNVEAGLTRLQQRLRSETEVRVIGLQSTEKRLWWRTSGTMLKAAAVGIVLLGAGLIWSRIGRERVPSMVAGSAIVSATTTVGERRVLDLSDGSQITLGPSSSATATVGATGPREVELVGEAFFRVTHDEDRPFVVRTGQTVIEDLGTEFTVRAVGGSAPVRVAVSSGSVSVRRASTSSGSDIVLQPRDMATLADTGEIIIARDIDVEPFQAWTSGRLVFRNASFAEAMVELERWYPVDFQISDRALLQKHLDVEFSGQSLDEVLSIVGRILEVRFVRRGQVVELAAPERTSMGASKPTEIGGGA